MNMGSGGSGKGSRGRGRRRPRGGGGGGGGSRPGGQKGPPVMHNPRRGKAFSTPYTVPDTGPIDPFDVFCACFMGLMPDGSYRGAGLGEAAKHLRRSPNELRQMLQDYGMDPETLAKVDFDLVLAKIDIQVAPEGIDRRELARGLFEEFCDLHPTLTCGPAPVSAVGGNGGAPEAPARPAPAPRREPEAAPESRPETDAAAEGEAEAPAAEPATGEPAEGAPMAAEPAEEEALEEEASEDETDEDGMDEEAPLAVVDAGVTRGAPAREGRADRPVRQIRRSPTRRGG